MSELGTSRWETIPSVEPTADPESEGFDPMDEVASVETVDAPQDRREAEPSGPVPDYDPLDRVSAVDVSQDRREPASSGPERGYDPLDNLGDTDDRQRTNADGPGSVRDPVDELIASDDPIGKLAAPDASETRRAETVDGGGPDTSVRDLVDRLFETDVDEQVGDPLADPAQPEVTDFLDGLEPEPATHEGPEAQSQESTEAAPRYTAQDLTPTGQDAEIYGVELMAGPDDRNHFPGDRIGTFRDDGGRLHDSETTRFVDDDNRPATDAVQLRAEPDVLGAQRYDPASDFADASPDVQDKARLVLEAAAERATVADHRAELWSTLRPLTAKLAEGLQESIGPKDFHAERFDELVQDAAEHLDDAEYLEFLASGDEFVKSTGELRAASERLGVAGGTLVAAYQFEGHEPVTGGDDARGTPGNFDRIITATIDDTSTLVCFEEKGAGGALGTKLVRNPADSAGPKVPAEQGSPEYCADTLEKDNKLAAAVAADPPLLARLQGLVDAGDVRYFGVRTSAAGIVTATEFRLDPDRLQASEITVLGGRKAGT
jgi:hypothetical protein